VTALVQNLNNKLR